jgi:hypothetical protein
MSYTPKVDDYVKWTDSLGQITEGWVYFVCKDYFTIEIRTLDKPDNLVNFHKKIHVLVLCYDQYWDEVQYVKNREETNVKDYKSQKYRYADVQ